MSIEFSPLASSSLGCAYLVKAEGHAPLLIDAGLSFTDLQRSLWAEGVNVSDLAGCLCSHGHSDHAKAVPKLLAAGVDVYASREAWEQGIGGAMASHRAKTLRPRSYVGIHNTWWLVPFDAVHDADGTLGFLINHDWIDGLELKQDSLLYLSDSAYCPHTFNGLTHICVEANYSDDLLKENAMAGRLNVDVAKRTIQTHSSIERVVDMLRANDLSKVEAIYLLHLSRANSDWRAFKDQVQKATGVATYVCAEKGGVE